MNCHIVLGRILQKFIDNGHAEAEGYFSFGYIRHTEKQIFVTRKTGQDTAIPFNKILVGIRAYQKDIKLYDSGPSALKDVGINYINSPIFALLHLLNKDDFI